MSKFDVLNPKLLWMGNKCYRTFEPIDETPDNPEDEELYEDDDDYVKESERKENNYGAESTFVPDLDVKIHHSDNQFWCTRKIPRALYSTVSSEANHLEKRRRHRVKIKLPKITGRTAEFAELTISSTNSREVEECYRRLDVVIEAAKLKEPFTHFVSVPMCFSELQKTFLEFRESVLQNFSRDRGVDRSLFQDPKKLHLTIVPLLLLDSQEIEEATYVLKECEKNIRDILRNEPLVAHVKGVDYMNDDPEEVDVLYGKIVTVDDSFQRISNLMLKKFNEKKLAVLKHDEDSVKLHLTFMNTTFRFERNPNPVKGERKKERETFDARRILKQFADFDFGTVEIKEIHISMRHTADKNGYYISSSLLNLVD